MTTPLTPEPPWAAIYPDGLDWRLAPVLEPVQGLLEDAVRAWPERPCLEFLGRRYTYAEVGDLASRVAKGLQHLGLRKGDRVGLCLPNSPFFVASYFGALKAGATVVNFNPLYTEDEIREQITDSGVTVMVTLDLKALYPKVAPALRTTGLRTVVVCSLSDALPPARGWLFQVFKRGEIAPVPQNLMNVPFDLLTANGDDPEPVEIDPATDVAVLQYTGGTTGRPKGAMLTHAALRTNAEQVRRWLATVSDGEAPERILAVLPFFHVFAMTAVMNLGLATGSELLLKPRFELEALLRAIHLERPTLFPAVPTLYAAINRHPDLERYDLTSIRYCVSGGAPLPIEVKRRFEDLTGCVLVEGYGLTEASPVAACNPPWAENRAGAIGVPLPGTEIEVRSLDNPAHPVADGEKGEVVVRGPQVMTGYWNRPEETLEVLEGGWLRTGDVGHMDGDGYVFLTDRLKEVILCSGYNVYPRIIEDTLYEHPAVAEAVVIGIQDDYRGEAPKAFVTLREGADAGEEDLLAYAQARLNPIERPVALEIREELPKTLIGKLSKKELMAEEARKREVRRYG